MIDNYKIAAVCVSEYHDEDVQSLLYPLAKQMAESGWRLLIFNTYIDLYSNNLFTFGEASVFELIDYSYVDALIIYDKTIRNQEIIDVLLREAKLNNKPAIVLNRDSISDNGIDIIFDPSDAFQKMMEHLLIEHNFKSFACIAGIEKNPASDKRERIFREELEKHQIDFDEKFLGYGGFYFRPTIEVMKRFFSYGQLPECIVCFNDSMAITVCEMLINHGYRIPEDVAVVGFDGIVQANYNYPKLSTCRIDFEDVSTRIIKVLDDRFNHFSNDVIRIPYSFQASESCGCVQHSICGLSKTINTLYENLQRRDWYERSNTNMQSKLSNTSNLEEFQKIVAHYFGANGFLVLNNSYCRVSPGLPKTFTLQNYTIKRTYRQFYLDNENINSGNLYNNHLLPWMKEMIERTDPWVIYPIHNQDIIFGYMATCAKMESIESYHIEQLRLHRLAASINNAYAKYFHTESMRVINENLLSIQDKIISGFADIVESRDDLTGQHVKRTSDYILLLLRHLAAKPKYEHYLTEERIDMIYKAAPLHDIGKIKISDIILNKPEKLTEEEFDIIRTHTTAGYDIIRSTLTGIEDTDYLTVASEMSLYHHERWDGKGYPAGISGLSIPFAARVMSVVDVFDALSNKRVYKEAFTLDDTFEILKTSSGTQFDPDLIDAFLEIREDIEKLIHKPYSEDSNK